MAYFLKTFRSDFMHLLPLCNILWMQATMPIKSHFSGTLKCNKYICMREFPLSRSRSCSLSLSACAASAIGALQQIFHARLNADVCTAPSLPPRVVVLLRMLQKLRVDVASAISKAIRGSQSQASSSTTASRKTKLSTKCVCVCG